MSLGRFKRALTDEMEQELAQHCRDLDSRFYGLTRKHVMKVAFDFAEINGVCNRFNNERRIAGKDWLKGFCKRNKLSVRTPEQCSMARAIGFNRVQVSRFYDNLKECCIDKKFPAHRKFNVDETGLSTVPNRTPKVLTPTGKKTVCKISSAERGETITAVCCMSATGIYVPPALIFPRKRMNHLLFKGAPTGTLGLVTETGYMNSDLFLEWLKHFVHHVKPSAEDPILLVADNHSTHCSLPAIIFCRNNHITFLTLPPHSSHVIQPLDKGFFAPMKAAYASEAEKWLVQHPGEVIRLTDVAGIFKEAYTATARVKLAEKAFEVTGIEPYNPDVINEELFAPSLVTDQPLRPQEDPCEYANPCTEQPLNEDPADSYDPGAEAGNSSGPPEEEQTPSQNITSNKIMVSVHSILPLPQSKQKETTRKRASQKSEIITASPFKNNLEQKEREKKELQEAKVKRALERADKANEKNMKHSKKTSKTRRELQLGSDLTRPSTSSTQTAVPEEEDDSIICPGCGTSFTENWVQCGLCKEWWHEDCSAYEGSGPFVCDYC